MVFHLRVTFKECQSGNLKNTTAAIGDTVLIRKDDGQVQNLTGNIPSKFSEITYTLDDDDDDEEEEKESEPDDNPRQRSRRA